GRLADAVRLQTGRGDGAPGRTAGRDRAVGHAAAGRRRARRTPVRAPYRERADLDEGGTSGQGPAGVLSQSGGRPLAGRERPDRPGRPVAGARAAQGPPPRRPGDDRRGVGAAPPGPAERAPGGGGAGTARGAQRLPHQERLLGRAAGAGGQVAGAVRLAGGAPDRGRGAAGPPALPRRPSGGGHGGPGVVLARRLPRGPRRTPRPLPQTPLARGPPHGHPHPAHQPIGVPEDVVIQEAALNNAAWCDALCRAHGLPGAFTERAWTNPRRTPPYYTDAVTLSPEATPADVLPHTDATPGASIKDSFTTLTPPGFGLLFEATWIHRPGGTPGAHSWKVVQD